MQTIDETWILSEFQLLDADTRDFYNKRLMRVWERSNVHVELCADRELPMGAKAWCNTQWNAFSIMELPDAKLQTPFDTVLHELPADCTMVNFYCIERACMEPRSRPGFRTSSHREVWRGFYTVG